MKMSPKVITGAIGMAAALALSVSTTQAQNLLVDPGFEAAPSQPNPILLPGGVNGGWSATFNGANFTAASAETGSLGLEMTEAAGSQWNFEGTYQVIGSIIAGQKYTFTEDVKLGTALSSTYGPAFIQLTYFNAAGTDLGTVESTPGHAFALQFTPTANWATYSVSATAPAGAIYVAPYVAMMENGSSTAIETLYADNGTLTLVPEPSILALLGMGLSLPFYFWRRRNS